MGNFIEKTFGKQTTSYEYDLLGRLTRATDSLGNATEYAYDGLGNLISETDALGNVTEYVYDSISSLKEIVYADGSSVKAQYDLAGRITGETDAEGNATLTWDILNGDGVVISTAKNGEVIDYTYGIERISAQTKGNRTEYVTDITGSVIAEISSKFLNTEVTTKAYTPFGETEASGFGFKGEYYNADTGMIYLRARFYTPEMNRFSPLPDR